MRKITIIIFFVLVTSVTHGAEKNKTLNMSCEDFNWSDIEALVQPYLDDALYTALVMQGQSANYKTSEAASQAMDESLPAIVKNMLQALINADC